MIRLHVVDDKIIRLLPAELACKVFEPFRGEAAVHRVGNGDLFVQYHIGIVGDPVRNGVLPLEQVDIKIVYSDIFYILGYFHCFSRFLSYKLII